MKPGAEFVAHEILGLVLAGGGARRMGRDKGQLDYHGLPQAVWAWRQLDALCERSYVSINVGQAALAPYSELPTLIDAGNSGGPATGLMTAWQAVPGVAWFVIGVDMPLLSEGILSGLLAARDPGVLATAYAAEDGAPEPLCAIWEAAAEPVLRQRIAAGDASLRRCLESGPARTIQLADAQRLKSANSPADVERMRRRLGRL